jgi:iron complex outermembrane receptor protein
MVYRYPSSLGLALTVGAAIPPAFAQNETESSRFNLGEIVVTGSRPDGVSSVGGSVVTGEQSWQFQRLSLEQALSLAPGVNTTPRGRRNEYDIFVRGFDRLQVPLMIDGVRIYLPADNRVDFQRFLTADVAAVQIQKGYASVLDGPGAMGGAINLVTSRPGDSLLLEGGVSAGGRSDVEDVNAYMIGGASFDNFYVQGSVAYMDRDFWTMSGNYVPTTAPVSLEDGDERISSYNKDWRVNFKFGFTPNDTDEYTLNVIQQGGEKGSPLNVYNNPPVPMGSFWEWPYWDVTNTAFLTSTELDAFTLKSKTYYNTFENGLQSFDNQTYTTQSAPYAFDSPYDDNAYGTSIELALTQLQSSTLKFAIYYRTDEHKEQQTSRPTHPTLRTVEPVQEQGQDTWSVAIENTFHLTDALDVVAGVSYDEYEITKAEEFGNHDNNPATPNILYERPRGSGDATNWQTAVIYRYNDRGQVHASISDRGRFPTFFELYSTRFGTATPNPDLSAERATNFEVGWEKTGSGGTRFGGAVFYNDVEDLVQTVVLPNGTTQAQNVGNGRFYGLEVFFDARVTDRLTVGGNYTNIDREIIDALQPTLEAEGVPDNKGLLYLTWQPTARFTLMPSIEAADDRWANVNTQPPAAVPYVRSGAYTLINLDTTYTFANDLELGVGIRNWNDDNYELAWGFPSPGRAIYTKLQMTF